MSLIIAEQPEQVFFKDEGGKKNFLKTFVKYKSTSKKKKFNKAKIVLKQIRCKLIILSNQA